MTDAPPHDDKHMHDCYCDGLHDTGSITRLRMITDAKHWGVVYDGTLNAHLNSLEVAFVDHSLYV